MSVRMTIDPETFSKVSAGFPQTDEWTRGITLASGRTGEIIALAGPEALKRQLRQHGLSDAQIQQVGAAVGTALKQALPRDAAEKIMQRVALLAGQ